MPDLGVTDPADLEAKARVELGFSRQLKQPRQVAPQPFFGGTDYPVWYREQQLEKWNAGEVTDISEWAPRAIPPDWQQGAVPDHWDRTTQSRHLYHRMARRHPRRDGGIHLQ
jgi:hypothetical protein